MSLREGETILNGKYHIVRLLGEGGCARVWLAEEPEFGGRKVAIKELRGETLAPAELAEQERRFRQEVEMAALLEQARVPHVIRAITLERLEDGTRLLVMEYAEGGSLADRIAEHPQGMPIEDAVQITLDICQALQAFHDLQVGPVHRDVKPSNILFDRDGKAYLSDFGLCQLPGRSVRTQMQAGPHPATPLYAAPEQLQSPEPLTPAADIFALGCVLFEMLTGKPYKRVKPGTESSALRPEARAWLDAVLAKALHEDRWERYQTAREMADDLRAGPVAMPKPTPAPAPESPPRHWRPDRRLVLALGLVVLIAVLAFGLSKLGVFDGGGQPTSTPSTQIALATDTLTSTPSSTPSITPTETIPTPTNTPTEMLTATPKEMPTVTPTETPIPTSTEMPIPTPTETRTATPTRTPIPKPTTTRTATPTKRPTPSPSASGHPTVGGYVEVVYTGWDGVWMRRSPGNKSKDDSDIIATLFPPERYEVIDGPQAKDTLTWWKLTGLFDEGWVAEYSDSGIRLIAPSEPPPMLGGYVEVVYTGWDGVWVRRSPGNKGKDDSDIIATLFPPERYEVIDGPQLKDDLVWWKLRGFFGDGWVAEYSGNGIRLITSSEPP